MRTVYLGSPPFGLCYTAPMDSQAIARLIEEGMPGARVHVASDDNTHFQALVVSESFAGLKAPARHRLVYGCLGERMGNEVHALSIRALTPDEWRAAAGNR